jgi:hypothetical protein
MINLVTYVCLMCVSDEQLFDLFICIASSFRKGGWGPEEKCGFLRIHLM